MDVFLSGCMMKANAIVSCEACINEKEMSYDYLLEGLIFPVFLNFA